MLLRQACLQFNGRHSEKPSIEARRCALSQRDDPSNVRGIAPLRLKLTKAASDTVDYNGCMVRGFKIDLKRWTEADPASLERHRPPSEAPRARRKVLSIKRMHGRISPIHSLVEMLVGLQLDEGLASGPRPEWAAGTSVAEIFDALKILGDGAWLGSRCPEMGTYEAADGWLNDFFGGKIVPTPDDAPADWPC